MVARHVGHSGEQQRKASFHSQHYLVSNTPNASNILLHFWVDYVSTIDPGEF